jgi:PIN domain nuclease of toxin-antitoxin system
VAKKIETGKLQLSRPVDEWIFGALSYPGVRLLELTPGIAVESTRLPGRFHRDPADQIIVATARVLNVGLLTLDQQILRYRHVTHVRR